MSNLLNWFAEVTKQHAEELKRNPEMAKKLDEAMGISLVLAAEEGEVGHA